MYLKSALVFLIILSVSDSSRILIMSLFRTNRHLFFELGQLLKEKQHDVSFLSYQNDISVFKKQNFNVYVVKPELNLSLDREFNEHIYQDVHLENAKSLATLNVLSDWCSILLNDSTLLNQVQAKGFEIFVTDLFANDICSISWANKLGIPVIGVWPMALNLPLAYHLAVPTMNSNEYSSSTFFERIQRIADEYFIMRKWNANYYQPILSVINKYHKENTNINELHEQLILIMTNENPILELDRPALSNIVSIGGFQCRAPNAIPKNVEDFSKQFRSGTIFVSIDFELSKSQKEDFIKTFNTFSSYAIIWEQKEKFENNPNVLTIININHQDILGHPRTRLFISSCDSLGTTSAIFHGVPVLCVTKKPQSYIGDQVSDRKIGLHIELDKFTENTFQKNINKLLLDKSYYHSIRQLSLIFRDQPEIPADRFVFWVEHVIRHKSAPLQTSKTRVYSSLYYYVLDLVILVLLFSLVALGIVIAISYVLTKFLKKSMSKGKME